MLMSLESCALIAFIRGHAGASCFQPKFLHICVHCDIYCKILYMRNKSQNSSNLLEVREHNNNKLGILIDSGIYRDEIEMYAVSLLADTGKY